MATNDVWRYSFIGSHSGTEIGIITMHIKFLTNTATFAGGAAYLKTNLLDLLKTKQNNTFRWDKIAGITVNTTPKVSMEYTTGFPVACTYAGEELAHQVALVVTFKTAYAGRSYRGRNYIPGMSEGYLGLAQFAGDIITGYQTYYDDLVAALGAGGSNADYQWVVWSEKLNVATPVTQAIVRTNPGVIRRRRIGVGQ